MHGIFHIRKSFRAPHMVLNLVKVLNMFDFKEYIKIQKKYEGYLNALVIVISQEIGYEPGYWF